MQWFLSVPVVLFKIIFLYDHGVFKEMYVFVIDSMNCWIYFINKNPQRITWGPDLNVVSDLGISEGDSFEVCWSNSLMFKLKYSYKILWDDQNYSLLFLERRYGCSHYWYMIKKVVYIKMSTNILWYWSLPLMFLILKYFLLHIKIIFDYQELFHKVKK